MGLKDVDGGADGLPDCAVRPEDSRLTWPDGGEVVAPGVEGLLAVVLASVGRPPSLRQVVVGVDAQVVLVQREGLLPEDPRVRVVVGRAGVQGALLLQRFALAVTRTTSEAEDVAEPKASSPSSPSR